ncbi:HD domain-containing phosphohydrolase [Jatrophihabitans sp. DSM 45814]
MHAGAEPGRIRLAELVAALSLGIDLGFGQPMEHVLRQCLIALRFADRLEIDVEARTGVYYTALLVNVGCHSDAYEQAKWFGDDIALKSGKYEYEGLRATAATMRLLGSGNPPLQRFRTAIEFAVSGHREVGGMIAQHARMARLLAEQLNLPAAAVDGVGSAYEQWDGRGWPGVLSGAEVPLAARIAQLSEYVEVAHRVGGVEGARELAKRRSGKQVDPMLADILLSDADLLLDGIETARSWDAVIEQEPSLAVTLSSDECDAALVAIANFVDLKSPYTLGHAVAVADLARESAHVLGMPASDVHLLYRAGLVHGLGRLGVSNSIWDRVGPLSAGEWERVRMYPYLTERMLHQSQSLAVLGKLAVQHRERLDGSGYPRGLSAGAISRPARVLAAAEAYQSKREPRPHRPSQAPGAVAAYLRDEVSAGRLDSEAVDAVLTASGHRVRRRHEGPAGLTLREIEILRLLARGRSNKEIAQQLVITPKTAGNHIEHIYAKVHASTRTAAALFAMQNGLLTDEEFHSTAPGWAGIALDDAD